MIDLEHYCHHSMSPFDVTIQMENDSPLSSVALLFLNVGGRVCTVCEPRLTDFDMMSFIPVHRLLPKNPRVKCLLQPSFNAINNASRR